MRRGWLIIWGLCGSLLTGSLLIKNAEATLVKTEASVAWEGPATPVAAIQADAALEFPLAIPGTTLIAQNLAFYEGPYLEDGSTEDVVDVASLVLCNTDASGIESARVELYWHDGVYVFEADTIPARTSVLVLERDRQKYVKHTWLRCVGTQVSGQGDWGGNDVLSIEETAMATVQITNISQQDLKNIRLYYKTYLSSADLLVGGITYSLGIPSLPAGQSVQLSPFRYVQHYSRFVRISWEEAE